MNVRGILFDAGDTLYGPIGGRWNPRFDFEEVLLRYHPEVPADRFAEAIAAGKRFMDTAPSTPPRDDYHRAILSELGIRDPSSDLLTDLSRPLDVPIVVVFPEVASVLAELREHEIRMAIVSDNYVPSVKRRSLEFRECASQPKAHGHIASIRGERKSGG